MLKEMMNTRQAVKSVEGYNTLSRREQDKIARESGLLICWIFGPMLLLIPLYFLLPEAWFENCLVYRGCESDGPYREDEAKPANIYGAHKLEMEQRVLDRQPDSVMLRAEWMYDYISPRGNYLLNVLNAKETLTFGRQYRGITYLREVCENLERIVKLPENGLQQSGKLSGETVLAENQPGEQDVILQLPGGVYNFGSETTQSMYEISKEFLQITGSRQQVQEGSLVHNLWMDCSKAAQYGIVFSDVMGGLRRCLADYGLLQ